MRNWKFNLRVGIFVIVLAVLAGIGYKVQQERAVNLTDIGFTDYTRHISEDRIYGIVEDLSAQDDARITGFQGEKDSAKYIEGEFKDMGLSVSRQSFLIQAYKCGSVQVSLLGAGARNLDCSYLNFSKGTTMKGITAEIAYVGMGAVEDFEGKDVKGKLVLMKRGGEYFRVKVARAAENGALGAIFFDPAAEKPVSATLVEPSNIPAAAITRADGEAIVKRLQDGKPIRMNLRLSSILKDENSKNVIATLKAKGKPSGKTIVVGAHYDSVTTPGANDNASGIAVVLELARLAAGLNLNCDVKFIAFGAEEIGLVGSSHYVSSLSSEELSNTICMMNFDMVGVGDTLQLHSLVNTASSKLVALARKAAEEFQYKNTSTPQENSDHVPFESAGIPTVYFEYGPYHDYHTDLDISGRIQQEDLLKACNIGMNVLVGVGNNPGSFARNQ